MKSDLPTDAPGQNPPAGMVVLKNGLNVKAGDWFFIESWGAWTPVPDSAIGQKISGARVARNLKKMTADEMTYDQAKRYLREAGFNMEHIEAFDRAMAKCRAILDEPNNRMSQPGGQTHE